jgi:poly(hydroxyalkanoate) depolymerase family esterase
MKPLLPGDMIEATRLTRAGRLNEAVALLQNLLRGTRAGNGRKSNASAAEVALPVSGLPIKLLAKSAPFGDVKETAGALPQAALHGGLDRIDLTVTGLPGGRRRGWPIASDMAPTAGRFVAGSFSNEAGTRTYKLYIPSRHSEPRPLIVMLHGCLQTADDFSAGTRMNFAAEESSCFVVYPEQPAAANASKCWNWFKQSDQRRGRGEPALIAGITRQVVNDYGIDARRIYIAGLSAGGAAAATMGETYPDLYAAVGVHSGLACGAARDLPTAFAAMRGHGPVRGNPNGVHTRRRRALPTIVFHGDQDTTVHPRNGTEVIARANTGEHSDASVERETVSSGRRYTRSVQRDAGGRSVLEQWELHGAGHAWSGGNLAGSFTDPTGPDATKEMLRFFLEHAQSAPHSGGSGSLQTD